MTTAHKVCIGGAGNKCSEAGNSDYDLTHINNVLKAVTESANRHPVASALQQRFSDR